MATRNSSKVKGSPSKPKRKLARDVKKSGSKVKRKQNKEKVWWQTAKNNRVVVVLAFLALIVQLCRWLVPIPAKASPAQPIIVQQIFQDCPVIVNTNIKPPSDKR
jgi:hypothetical protein